MKPVFQTSLYFIVIFFLVAAGFGFMFNRLHMMDVAHQRLNQELSELQLITSFLGEVDQLITAMSGTLENDYDYFGHMKALAKKLEDIREESLRPESFEEKRHVKIEKRDFIRIYDQFQDFLQSSGGITKVSAPEMPDSARLVAVQHLVRMRVACSQLQDYYIEQSHEASRYAQKTRQQIMQRTVIISVLFFALLGIMAGWFIYLITSNTRAIISREKDITIGLLAQSLSHEIRNPLSIIKSSTSVIRKKLSPDCEEYEIAGFLTDEVDRINNLVDQILQLRTSAPVKKAEENPAQIIQQVIVLLTGICKKHDVSIIFNNEVGGQKILCDRNQLKQVVINIILNAIEASAVQDSVEVVTRMERTSYCISVRDNGPGFPPRDFKKAFTPFFTTKKNGSGLGLYTAKNMIEANGGNIVIDSAPGQGTVVTMCFKVLNAGRVS